MKTGCNWSRCAWAVRKKGLTLISPRWWWGPIMAWQVLKVENINYFWLVSNATDGSRNGAFSICSLYESFYHMWTICVRKWQKERWSCWKKIVGFNLLIWCPRACEVSNKNVFMQIGAYLWLFGPAWLPLPFTQFLIIYSFEEGKKEK